MPKIKLQLVILCNLFLLCIVVALFVFKSKNEIVYVDSERLFNEFLMTKEMKRQGEKQFNIKKAVLDSLYRRLQTQNLSDQERENVAHDVIAQKEALQYFNEQFSVEEGAKIRSRLQDYMKQFSLDNQYEIVLGAVGERTVWYADAETNVTDAALQYLNKKYEGGK